VVLAALERAVMSITVDRNFRGWLKRLAACVGVRR